MQPRHHLALQRDNVVNVDRQTSLTELARIKIDLLDCCEVGPARGAVQKCGPTGVAVEEALRANVFRVGGTPSYQVGFHLLGVGESPHPVIFAFSLRVT